VDNMSLILKAPPSYRRKCPRCGELYTYYPDDPEPCPMCAVKVRIKTKFCHGCLTDIPVGRGYGLRRDHATGEDRGAEMSDRLTDEQALALYKEKIGPLDPYTDKQLPEIAEEVRRCIEAPNLGSASIEIDHWGTPADDALALRGKDPCPECIALRAQVTALESERAEMGEAVLKIIRSVLRGDVRYKSGQGFTKWGLAEKDIRALFPASTDDGAGEE